MVLSQLPNQQVNSSRETRAHPSLRAASWLSIGLVCFAVFYANLRFHEQVLAIGLEDDFFYYAQAAKNFVFTGTSTFDGSHLTNGYHPLWFLIIAAITKIFSIGGIFDAKTIYPFAIAIETLQMLIVVGTAYLSFRIVSKFCSEKISLCVQLLTVGATFMQVRTGMETGLAIMAVLALVAFRIRDEFQWNAPNSFLYGILGSVAILSRLDVALIVGPMVGFDLLNQVNGWRARFKISVIIALGLIPLAAYFLSNIIVFHTLMPVSGAAKQLRAHHFPSSYALHTFTEFLFAKNSPLLFFQVIFTVLALLRFKKFSQTSNAYPVVFLAMLVFPIVHLAVITSASDWQLFLWYIYPWTISSVAAGIVLFSEGKQESSAIISGRYETPAVYCCAVFLLLYGLLVSIHSSPGHNLPYQAALEIKKFEQGHQGIYGMGDRAGAVGYFGQQPVVQLEGLMMDKNYLENIRKEKDLLETLRKYHVRYYISTRAERGDDGCWHVKEPWQAGPDSPSMSGKICKTPLAVFKHDRWVNDIFDIDGTQ